MLKTHLSLITAPTDTPVSLDDFKRQIYLGDITDPSGYTDEDESLTLFLNAAVAYFDGKAGVLYRCLMPQTWKLTIDWAFPTDCSGHIALPLGPVRGIESITYIDAAGDEQTINPAAYELVLAGEGDDAYVQPVYGTLWPVARCQAAAAAITYQAGDANAAAVPAALRAAILMMAAHLYRNREAAGDTALSMNPAMALLVQPYKRMMTTCA